MAKQTIAIDIDDVLADSTEAFRIAINNHLGVNLSPKDYWIEADYDRYYEDVWAQNGLSDKISYTDLEFQMIEDQSHIKMHTGAQSALNELAKRYRLIVITSRPVSWRKATDKWIENNFPNIFNRVLFAEENGKSKGYLCRQNGASWLIDDNVEHAQSAADENIEIILFGDYGWHYRAPAHFCRCKDWSAVLEYFNARA